MTTLAAAYRRHAVLVYPHTVARLPRSVVVLGAVFLIGCALYLVQVNGLATKGYQIQDLQRRSRTLSDSNLQLEVQISQLQSFQEVAGRVQQLEMVHPPQVVYVDGLPTVALGR